MKSTFVETARLQMRRMTYDDVAALLTVFGDAEVMRFYPAPFDCERMQEWVDWNQRNYTNCGYGLWALILRATGELIGDCGLVNQQVDGVLEIEIGYHIRRDLWGQGLATEAALACRDYGFNILGYQRLVSLIHPQNAASRRVAEKVGMTLCREAQWKDKLTCIYAIERTAT
ncbi:MAG TPA: GNAT family N-acetyltransferase [Phycisphaerae bacterium]|nr:GNAT family N-acetyltransferase [Phycisphaerae bacterium]